ncbi:hypothetical protein DUNSADRAFT_5618 [Dunaliella salina]|uniref:Uncharacterized protein n=1 Tax=Dunaliella salina TaxID=3046 RepID=A0ABQ7GPW8_DUNSA|nr:hypothetical protein DUNSADRAFT_5618 [Dunaliella salina]|eukprot:KAF5836659.1 hypothetical protein DUNSADRAFT_5618 [Dunaliella salina]
MQFKAWEADTTHPAPTHFALTIVKHISSHSSTRVQGAKRQQIRRQQQALALQLQPQQPTDPSSTANEQTAHSSDDSDEDAWQVDPDAPAPAEQAYIASLQDFPQPEAPSATPPTSLLSYISASAQLLAGVVFTAASASNATTRQLPTHQQTQRLLQQARRAAAGFTPTLALDGSNSADNNTHLHVLQGGNAWRLDVLHAQDSTASASIVSTAAGGPPPFVRANQMPTIQEFIRLFGLSSDQAHAFAFAAYLLGTERAGAQLPPLHMITVDRPRTGKTRLLRAIEWWTLQLAWSDNVVKAAYTLRASKQLDSPLSCGHSTCYTFGINSFGGKDTVVAKGSAAERRAQFLGGSARKLLVVDESSFLSGTHFAAMHTASTLSRPTEDSLDIFGGHHLILCKDPCQHEPVPGTPLHALGGSRSSNQQQGQLLYKSIPAIFMLTTQHRCSIDPEADRLARYASYFDGLARPSAQEIEEFVDALQQRHVHNITALAADKPGLVLLRSCVRSTLNLQLAAMHAKQTARRVLVWPSTHWKTGGGALTDIELRLALDEPSNHAKGIPALGMYFDGARVAFADNEAPESEQ